MQTINMIIQLEMLQEVDRDEQGQLTRQLMQGLEDIGVESVAPLQSGRTFSGEKGGDPITWGALGVLAIQTMLPKILEFLQAWSLRSQEHVVKLKVQFENHSIEVEYPVKMNSEDLRKHVSVIIDALKDGERSN